MQDTMDSLESLTNHVNECNMRAENEAQLEQLSSSLVGLEFVSSLLPLLGVSFSCCCSLW